MTTDIGAVAPEAKSKAADMAGLAERTPEGAGEPAQEAGTAAMAEPTPAAELVPWAPGGGAPAWHRGLADRASAPPGGRAGRRGGIAGRLSGGRRCRPERLPRD